MHLVKFRHTRAFAKDQTGTATVSFVIWLPFVTGIIMLVADLASIMFQHANVDRVLQDANRLWATGMLSSGTETEQYITTNLTRPDGTVIGTRETDIIAMTATSTVRMQLTEIDMFGFFSTLVGDRQVVIRNQQVLEQAGS
jgi:Flp pilus assembly protein TadG